VKPLTFDGRKGSRLGIKVEGTHKRKVSKRRGDAFKSWEGDGPEEKCDEEGGVSIKFGTEAKVQGETISLEVGEKNK